MHFKQRSFIWKMVMKVLPFGSTLKRCGLAIVIPFFAIVEFFSCLMVDKDLNCISQIWEHWFGNYIYWRKWRLSRQLGALLDVLYFNMSHCPCIVGLNARLSFVLSWHKAPPLITLEFVFMSIQSIHISIPQFKFALQLLASSIEDASMFQLYPFLTYMSLHSLYIKL